MSQATEYRETDFDTHPSLTTRKAAISGLPEFIEDDAMLLGSEIAAEELALSAKVVEFYDYPISSKQTGLGQNPVNVQNELPQKPQIATEGLIENSLASINTEDLQEMFKYEKDSAKKENICAELIERGFLWYKYNK